MTGTWSGVSRRALHFGQAAEWVFTAETAWLFHPRITKSRLLPRWPGTGAL